VKLPQKKKGRAKKSSLDDSTFSEMVEQATVDAYGESEHTSGWFAMFENHLEFPFETEVLGMRANVAKIDLRHDRIVAVCKRGARPQVVHFPAARDHGTTIGMHDDTPDRTTARRGRRLGPARLAPEAANRFYRAWMPLLKWVNDVERVVPIFPLPSAAHPIAPETAALVRDALWSKEELHARFVRENPMGLAETELAIVASFRDRVSDRFTVAKHFAGHSIFLRSSTSVGYEVLGIVSELRDTLPVPSFVEATLLPFEGRIIYDGLLRAYPISFGPGARGMVARSYADAKSRKILSALPPRG
jgi:hypothetical protein